MISIIIPSFNSLKELKVTLPSLYRAVRTTKQSIEREFEIILSDDGSDDGTQQWVRSNYPDIRYFWHKNMGRGPNRNFGAAQVNGEYLLFMDSDIEVEPHAIRDLLISLLENPDIISFGNIRLAVGEKPSPLSHYLSRKCEKLMHRFGETLNPWDSYSAFFSVSKKYFDQLKGFSAGFTQYGGEDTEFFLRCSKAGVRFFFAKDAIGWHHQALDLNTNLHRAYLSNYSSALIPYPHPAATNNSMTFSRAWYDRVFRVLTVYRLWSKFRFLHWIIQYFPSQSRTAFYFYNFLFQEHAVKGQLAGKMVTKKVL